MEDVSEKYFLSLLEKIIEMHTIFSIIIVSHSASLHLWRQFRRHRYYLCQYAKTRLLQGVEGHITITIRQHTYKHSHKTSIMHTDAMSCTNKNSKDLAWLDLISNLCNMSCS
jgi:hypothetical protein